MRLIDGKGRVLGWVNAIDLAAVVLVAALCAVAYLYITAGHRVAEPFPLERSVVWARIELRLPPTESWLADFIAPGLAEHDRRSGAVVAELLGTRDLGPDGIAVDARVRAVRDGTGRLVYGDRLLVPGTELTVRTHACVVTGLVARVEAEEAMP